MSVQQVREKLAGFPVQLPRWMAQDDFMLERFLLARQGAVDDAVEMVLETVRWHDQVELESDTQRYYEPISPSLTLFP